MHWVDVMTAMEKKLEAPRSTNLMLVSAAVLGRVLRDPVVLEEARRQYGANDHYARRAILVAAETLSILSSFD